MVGLDIRIVVVANPTIERALGFSAQTLQWTVTAYSLGFGGFLLLGGRLADRYGRRTCFIIGMAGFTTSSLGAAASHSAVQLILWRGAQGVSASVVSPAALSPLSVTVPTRPPPPPAYAPRAPAP